MSSVNGFKMIIEHGVAFLILVVVLPLITVKMRTTLEDTLLQLVITFTCLVYGSILLSSRFPRMSEETD